MSEIPTTDGAEQMSSLRFTAIDLSMKKQIEAIRISSCSMLHVFTFASLFSWQLTEQYGVCLSDGAFLVKYGSRGENAYLFPCGSESGKKRMIDALLQNGSPVFYFVSEDDMRFAEDNYPGKFLFEECRDDFPYRYDKDAQIAMSGKEYKGLRHEVNFGRATAEHWTTEVLTDENACRAVLIDRRWAASRVSGDVADLDAAETALMHFSDLDMWGVLFQTDGEDTAYVAGTFITPEIYDICFCKVLDKRCDCFVKWALYGLLPPEVKTVDSEEDMGLEGLRRHKLLRRPKELVRVWKGQLR